MYNAVVEPLTVAEKTNYQATSLYADVLDFIRQLEKRSDKVKVEFFGKSHEGREMPLVILSGKKLFTPQSAQAAEAPVILILNNIHAGEVEGKEASLILAREMLFGDKQDILDKVVVLIVPLFNLDGNEKISPMNRPLDMVRLEGQIGPDRGVGTRTTAGGYNLNRDYMKVEAVEMANLAKNVYYRWLPHITVDCHTTNGSIHGYELTYGTAMNRAGNEAPIDYMHQKMLPQLTESLFKRAGFRTFFYGNFVDENDPAKGWSTYSHKPRYGSNYRGLTNRFDILSEAYSYLPFEERVAVTKEFLVEILEYTSAHRDEMMAILEKAERETVRKGAEPSAQDRVGIQFALEPFEQPLDVLRRHFSVTVEYDTREKAFRYSHFQKHPVETFRAKYYGRFVSTKTVQRPYAYLIPKELTLIIEKLKSHNVAIEQLTEAMRCTVERYKVAKIEHINAVDYGAHSRRETILQTTTESTQTTFEAGTFVVRLAQPQGNLMVYLLEPESDDGLATWGYFDAHLREGAIFPVARVLSKMGLKSKSL